MKQSALRALKPSQAPTSVDHFDVLAKALELPEHTLVGDAIHFMIGDGLSVVGVRSEKKQLLLLVELLPMDHLSSRDWQRLIEHLSAQINAPQVGRLMVMDKQLSLAWSFPDSIDLTTWTTQARLALLHSLEVHQVIAGTDLHAARSH
jgi:hypothetical protein